MPIFGKIGQALGQIGRFYTSPEGIQNLQATFQDMANPGGGAFQSLQARRMQLAQQQQQQQAIQDLLAQMQPDTMTPQVNELIGEANMAGRGRFDPMAQMQPKAPAFDFTSPQGQAALMNALGAGISPDGISGLRDLMTPKTPERKLFNTRSGVVSIDPESGEASEVYSDPYAEALAQRQIDAQSALAEQRRAAGRANMIRANRPPAPPRARAAAPTAGPSIDQPWTLFKQ